MCVCVLADSGAFCSTFLFCEWVRNRNVNSTAWDCLSPESLWRLSGCLLHRRARALPCLPWPWALCVCVGTHVCLTSCDHNQHYFWSQFFVSPLLLSCSCAVMGSDFWLGPCSVLKKVDHLTSDRVSGVVGSIESCARWKPQTIKRKRQGIGKK